MSGENTAAGAEAGAASDGARRLGRRERRRAAATREVAHATQCSTPGCERSFRTRRCFHNHCCSLCTVGSHTARCDEHWRRFQRDGARRRLSICAVRTCGRLAGLTHVHCCLPALPLTASPVAIFPIAQRRCHKRVLDRLRKRGLADALWSHSEPYHLRHRTSAQDPECLVAQIARGSPQTQRQVERDHLRLVALLQPLRR